MGEKRLTCRGIDPGSSFFNEYDESLKIVILCPKGLEGLKLLSSPNQSMEERRGAWGR